MKIIIFILFTSLLSAGERADRVHEKISKEITSFATTIDQFFANKKTLNYENRTRLRIFTDTFFRESKKPLTHGNINFQLILPGTEKRFQLIIESKEEDQDSKNVPTAGTDKSVNTNTKAGVRYLFKTPNIKTTLSTGILFRGVEPQLFTRLRFRKNFILKSWLFNPEQEIEYITNEGVSTTTELDFDKKINDSFLFRFVNNATWNNTDFEINFSNGPSLFHIINERIAISYNARFISSDAPELAVNDYSLSFGFRQLLYSEWFFWTFSPALNFPREEDFRRVPSLSVRFEVILGHI